eukprot:TRINITY_DN6001_c0_g1_i5.p1 TRINITY_DN6001_c0_g1~~TRINITY_DN6001_c0_g1_i5.p1  ORF type:complete len:737 (-),score=210.23 TRINITY_DN6001_c0_g1_i5:208-2418(-)
MQSLLSASNKLRSTSPPKKNGRSISPPYKGKHQLRITIVEAKNLSKEQTVMSDVVGGMTDDPLCKISIGKKSFKTTVKPNTLNPIWNETFIMDVDPSEDLILTIRDNITIGTPLYKGYVFGEVVIPLSKLSKGEEYEEWIPLSKRKSSAFSSSTSSEPTGSIFVKISLQQATNGATPSEDSRDSKAETSEDEMTPNVVIPSISLSAPIEIIPPPSSSLGQSGAYSTSAESSPKEIHSSQRDGALSLSAGNTPSASPKSLAKRPLTTESTVEKRRMSASIPILPDDPISRAFAKREDQKKSDIYRRRFTLSEDDILLKEFSAALLKGGLLQHGKFFISRNFFCFYSNLFGFVNTEKIPVKDIIEIRKIHNISMGITLFTTNNKYNFTSFFSRDKAYAMMVDIWESVTSGKDLSIKDDGDASADEGDDLSVADIEDDEWTNFISEEAEEETGFLKNSDNWTSIMDEELSISVVKFFKIFFSDGTFTEALHTKRGDSEISVGPWTPSAEFGTVRQISFRSPLNHPIGPSSAICRQTQRYHFSKSKLTVQTVLITEDIPFGDSFRVEGRWEVTQGMNGKGCHIQVSVGAHFMKKTFFKGRIEAGVLKETKESMAQWLTAARDEVNKQRKGSNSSDSIAIPASDAKATPTPVTSLPSTSASTKKTSRMPSIPLDDAMMKQVVGIFFLVCIAICIVLEKPTWAAAIGVVLVGVVFLQMQQTVTNLQTELNQLNAKLKESKKE